MVCVKPYPYAVPAVACFKIRENSSVATHSVRAIGRGIDCDVLFGKEPGQTTLVFVADDGTFSGTDEALFIKQNLKSAKQVSAFGQSCNGGATVGTLMGQRVMAITSGIGPMQAQACVQLVMLSCADKYKDAFYMGTSGFPAAVGGILNPPQCNATNGNRGKGQVIRIGDLCIPTFAVSWDCRSASWEGQSQGAPNSCSAPKRDKGPTADYLYGKCLYVSPPEQSIALAKELAGAARSQSMLDSMPPRVPAVGRYETEFWDQMIAGTGDRYHTYATEDRTVNVWDHTQCVEVGTQFFFSGAPWEFDSRAYAAITLNKALNTTKYNTANVVFAAAMEGIGFSAAMEDYTSVNPDNIVPYVMMRAAADWSHKPMRREGNGVWGSEDLQPDLVAGYAQAIQSYSNAFLTMMKLRCLAQSLKDCSFSMVEDSPASRRKLMLDVTARCSKSMDKEACMEHITSRLT